jgi:tetratricopeptide (TPR) repeat protein
VFVLAEVENDHRMFFPFVGLAIAVSWAAALLVFRMMERRPAQRRQILLGVKVITAVLVMAYAAGTWQRNIVWHTEKSLWYDVTIKSPENGRGLMNYGLALMGEGDGKGALDYFQRAAIYNPTYATLEINTGIVYGLLKQPQDSEAHFRRAMMLAPLDAQPLYFYARWLKQQGRIPEAIGDLKSAIALNPPWMPPRTLLMETYQEQSQAAPLRDLAQDTLRIAPGDNSARQFLVSSQNIQPPLVAAEKLAESQPTADHYLNLSLLYHQAGRYQECIEAARKALKLKPDFAEAYNNIAAANEAMHKWDDAIAAAQHALRINPNFQLAKNNLAYSQSQKQLKVR